MGRRDRERGALLARRQDWVRALAYGVLSPAGLALFIACGSGLGSSSGDAGADSEVFTDGGCLALPGADGCANANPLEWAQWRMPNSPGDVKRGAPNLVSYTDNGDGTVTDNVTGLMWQKDHSPATLTWGCSPQPGSAQGYCASLNLAGHTDWRLPKLIELVSLLDYSNGGGGIILPDEDGGVEAGLALDTRYFSPGAASDGVFWSDSHEPNDPNIGGAGPWAMDFYGASPTSFVPSTTLLARCVR